MGHAAGSVWEGDAATAICKQRPSPTPRPQPPTAWHEQHSAKPSALRDIARGEHVADPGDPLSRDASGPSHRI